MANRPLPPEQMQELESAISQKELSADNNVSEIDKAIQKEEDRSLVIEQTKSIKELTAELKTFREEVFPVLQYFEGITINVDPEKIYKAVSEKLKPIPKEFADLFLSYTKEAISYLKALDTHITISEFWGIIFGLSLFWQTLFFTAVACLNNYLLHSSKLSSVIWIFGGAWILSIGLWIYLWRKFKMK